jgi:hypothetical protein
MDCSSKCSVLIFHVTADRKGKKSTRTSLMEFERGSLTELENMIRAQYNSDVKIRGLLKAIDMKYERLDVDYMCTVDSSTQKAPKSR